MTQRLDYKNASPKGFAAMLALELHARASGLEHGLLELVKTRVSQLNAGIAVTRSPFLTFFTCAPTSTTFPQNSCPGTQGNEVNGIAEGESFMNMRLMSLPHTPQSFIFIFIYYI